jgi:hypothetical protein
MNHILSILKEFADNTEVNDEKVAFYYLSCLVLFSSCLILSCLVLSCLGWSGPFLYCLVLSCLVVALSCLVLSCRVVSCRVLSCLVWSRLVWSCPVLSCVVLSCPVVALSCLCLVYVLSCLVVVLSCPVVVLSCLVVVLSCLVVVFSCLVLLCKPNSMDTNNRCLLSSIFVNPGHPNTQRDLESAHSPKREGTSDLCEVKYGTNSSNGLPASPLFFVKVDAESGFKPPLPPAAKKKKGETAENAPEPPS